MNKLTTLRNAAVLLIVSMSTALLPPAAMVTRASAASVPSTQFTDSYKDYNVWDAWFNIFTTNKCTLGTISGPTAMIVGQEPAAAGKYPLFVFLYPTYGEYDSGSGGATFTNEAVDRGFVGAAIKYDSGLTLQSTPGIEGHAKCIFSSNSPDSAITKLCARPKVDCTKGIIVSGFSQGASIADRAANYTANVRAAYLTGISNPSPDNNYYYAAPRGTRAIPNNRVRIINGQSDTYNSGTAFMNATTGQNCAATTFNCLATNGSGYYMVQDSEVSDGQADHCYFMLNGCSYTTNYEPNWQPPSNLPWSLKANMDWATQFATK